MRKTFLLFSAALFFAAAASEGQPLEFRPLPYAYDALEPHMDAKTMRIH